MVALLSVIFSNVRLSKVRLLKTVRCATMLQIWRSHFSRVFKCQMFRQILPTKKNLTWFVLLFRKVGSKNFLLLFYLHNKRITIQNYEMGSIWTFINLVDNFIYHYLQLFLHGQPCRSFSVIVSTTFILNIFLQNWDCPYVFAFLI